MRAIEVEDLHVRHGRGRRSVTAVRGVSFHLDAVEFGAGEVLGLLGPNGAGKSSTVAAIVGLQHPSGGRVRLFGLDPVAERRRLRPVVGVQLQEADLHGSLRVEELLRLYASLYPTSRDVGELLGALGLTKVRDTPFDHLSGGQQQRVSIAVALVGNPRLVVLDELTTGLDPRGRRRIWRVVEQLRDNGVSVLLVSHAMDEVAWLCDRVVLLDQGEVRAAGTPRDLAAAAGLAPGASLDEAYLALIGERAEDDANDEELDEDLEENSMSALDLPVYRPGRRAGLELLRAELLSVARDTAGLVVPFGMPSLLVAMYGLQAGDARIEGSSLTYLEAYGLPSAIAMVLALIGVVNMPSFLATYRRTGVLRRLGVTPLGPSAVLGAQVVASLIQSVIGIALAVGVAMIGFGAAPPGSPGWALVVLALGAFGLYGLGMIVAALAPTPNASVAIGLVVFFAIGASGGMFGPVETLPPALAAIGVWLPYGATTEALLPVWSGGTPAFGPLAALAGTGVVGFAVAVRTFRWGR